jgi:hypothetical protein
MLLKVCNFEPLIHVLTIFLVQGKSLMVVGVCRMWCTCSKMETLSKFSRTARSR